jgi:hypothetical protein
MGRTVAYGRTAAVLWDGLAGEELPDATAELTEGRRAYTAEKAARERRTCDFLQRQWASILVRADEYLEGSAPVDSGEIMIQLDLGDELEPDDEEALLEGDIE